MAPPHTLEKTLRSFLELLYLPITFTILCSLIWNRFGKMKLNLKEENKIVPADENFNFHVSFCKIARYL